MERVEVRIEGLTLPMFIGVLDFERAARQTVEIDIAMRVRAAPAPPGADEYVSYAPVVDHLRALSRSERHIELVEDLAEEVFAFLFADPRIAAATVGVRKPDIFPEARAVGVRVTRRNPAR